MMIVRSGLLVVRINSWMLVPGFGLFLFGWVVVWEILWGFVCLGFVLGFFVVFYLFVGWFWFLFYYYPVQERLIKQT